jgi:hypothetical protein
VLALVATIAVTENSMPQIIFDTAALISSQLGIRLPSQRARQVNSGETVVCDSGRIPLLAA